MIYAGLLILGNLLIFNGFRIRRKRAESTFATRHTHADLACVLSRQTAKCDHESMGFKESLLRGRIDGLKNNIARREKRGEDQQRIQNLKEELAATEHELEELIRSREMKSSAQ